jgi:hypothetical protein
LLSPARTAAPQSRPSFATTSRPHASGVTSGTPRSCA